jgi:hypothetical protein
MNLTFGEIAWNVFVGFCIGTTIVAYLEKFI